LVNQPIIEGEEDGMPRGRPRNTAQRRDQIVDGLLTVMAETGYQKASIQRIARAAGLSPGLVHYHFGSKREVLLGLVEHLETTLRVRYEARSPGTSALPAFLAAHLDAGEDADPRAVRAWVALGSEALRDPEVRAVYQDAVRRRRDLLVELLARARPQATRPQVEAFAGLVLASLEGALVTGTLAPEVIPPGTAAGALADTVARWIEAP
jgi:TetR/AcrR family transcriptional repressor of bet genes